jgi:hypothetical protein
VTDAPDHNRRSPCILIKLPLFFAQIERFVSFDIGKTDTLDDMTNFPEQRAIDRAYELMADNDYIALFSSGCCWHFALAIHKKYGYEIRGVSIGNSPIGHVWCQLASDSTKGIDVHGVYAEELLEKLANDGKRTGPSFSLKPRDLRKKIREKRFPLDLNKRLTRLACWLLKTHRRFAAARPLTNGDKLVCDRFFSEAQAVEKN